MNGTENWDRVHIVDSVVYDNRAANAQGLVQAGLREQNEPLSRSPFGLSSLHATPHGGFGP